MKKNIKNKRINRIRKITTNEIRKTTMIKMRKRIRNKIINRIRKITQKNFLKIMSKSMC